MAALTSSSTIGLSSTFVSKPVRELTLVLFAGPSESDFK